MSDEKSGPQGAKTPKKRTRAKKEVAPAVEAVDVSPAEAKPVTKSETKSPEPAVVKAAVPIAHEGGGRSNENYPVKTPSFSDKRSETLSPGVPAPSRVDRKPVDERPRTTDTVYKSGDEFSWQAFYDKATRQFSASVCEFPELKASGNSREAAMKALESKVDQHVQNLKRRNAPLPEAISARRFPERLEVKISQNLHRRLDALSRQEKVNLDQVVTELLTIALDKKTDANPGQNQHPNPHPQQRGHRNNNQNQQHHQESRGNQRHSANRRPARGYNESLENRENFMEYVRNLEKGNLRKK
jgi:predicted RNase H-like HicB family nuclease